MRMSDLPCWGCSKFQLFRRNNEIEWICKCDNMKLAMCESGREVQILVFGKSKLSKNCSNYIVA